MAEAKLKNWRIFMESADGKQNRTIELQAETKDKARKIAERQAEDIAEEHGGEAYSVQTVDSV
jgi:hypothetical protein